MNECINNLHSTNLYISKFNFKWGNILSKKSIESKEKKQKKSKKINEKKPMKTKKTDEKKPEPKFMNKKVFLIISVIVIICIIGFIWFILTPDTVAAQLVIDSGTVQVKHLGSWTDAINGTELYQSDSIRTGINSFASIIFFKGSVIRLDENTEITLKEIIQQDETSITIQQDAGRTWNTVQKISGIDNYEVQTPTAVASVRGTSFDVNVEETGITIVSVIKGIVNVSKTEDESVYTVELEQDWSITVDHDEIGQQEEFEPDEWIEDNLLEDETFRGELKDVLYNKIEPYVDELKTLYDMTDEEIEVLIEGFISGDFSIPPETPEIYKKLFDLS